MVGRSNKLRTWDFKQRIIVARCVSETARNLKKFGAAIWK